MFSANENIILRQHKRRIVEYVESTIPEAMLDSGTSVMAMEVSCKTPGCAPLETVIVVIFPRRSIINSAEAKDEAIARGEENKEEGSFKTTILKPMVEITKDDVLDALPPDKFIGGRKTVERECLFLRDMMLNHIEKLYPNDKQGKILMANYLKATLQEYIDLDCIAPEFGQPFPAAKPQSVIAENDGKNFVISRPIEQQKQQDTNRVTLSQTDWRMKQKMMDRSSSSLIQQISDREHAAGIRRPGCPCCDPDNLSNISEKLLGGMI